MAKRKGTTLGATAVKQTREMYGRYKRDYVNDPPHTPRQPVIQGEGSSIRHGILTEDLVGQTTVPAKANEIKFYRNQSDSGSHGSWGPVVDSDGQVQFKVIDNLLPTNKKIPAGRKIDCVQCGHDVWKVIAAECPVSV